MKILAVDSSGPVASVAVMEENRITHEIIASHGLTHSETLMPMVDQALSAAGLCCADIDLYACVAGPGSFTGVRIGVCAVKGMAHAVGRPAIAIDALEALAADVWGFDGIICPILDARRDQVYAAAFRETGAFERETVIGAAALSLGDFFAQLPGDARLYFTGDGVAPHEAEIAAHFGARAVVAPAHRRYLRASAACFLAARRADAVVDAAGLRPIYLRAPQAERERAARMAREQ